MSRTKIFLPSSGSIDMYDDVSTPLNFSIADIRFPEKRNSNYSKTIKIPGTKNNNLLFGNIFNVNITDGTFNPNAKVKAILTIDDESQINGYLQMLNIIINDDNKVDYEVAIIGNVGSVFGALGKSELSELDFSEFNHSYDYATQIASWTHDYTDGYVYPLIDYGFDNVTYNFSVDHLYPSIFVRTYIDKILSNVGYTYTSTFFDSDFFKKLIIPTNSGKIILTDAQIAPRLFYANLSAPYALTNTLTQTVLEIDHDVYDVSGQYDTGVHKWQVLTSGYYDVHCNINIQADINVSATMRITKNGTTIASTAMGVTLTPHADSVNVSNYYFVAGDIIQVTIAESGGLLHAGTYTINDIDLWNVVVNNGIHEGDICYLSNAIPLKVTQKDFLLNIIKMFNLFVDVDKNNDKNLIIESRDDFYSSGTNLDWSYKLDNSKDIEFRPMGDLDYKEFICTYTEDTDYFNKKYKDNYLEIYGQYRYINQNEFQTNINETKVIFSPTPLVGDNSTDRIIPRIWNVDPSNTVSPKACNIRILYLGGVKTSSVNYNYISVSGTHSLSQYLYAGHLDDTANPTLDLSFGVPHEIYYYTALYTNNNLFNRFFKKQVDEITDKDSKIVTAYFYLRPSDIRNLDFRNQFYFKNQYFRLNKIYDYDPLRNDVTKCEFIKIKEAGQFTAKLHSLTGGIPEAFEAMSDMTPVFSNWMTDAVNNISVLGAARSMVGGSGNIFDDNLRGCIVQGNSNIIGNSTNVALLGNSSGNIIDSGLDNVVLINTFDTHVTTSNVSYLNGFNVTSSGVLQTVAVAIPSASVLTFFTIPILVIPAPLSTQFIEIESVSCEVVYNSAAYGGTTTIDITTDTALIPQYRLSQVLQSSVSTIKKGTEISSFSATSTQMIRGKGVYASVSTSNPTTGNSGIIIYISYRII